MEETLLPFLHCAVVRQDLTAEQAREAMLAILEGHASTAQIAALLIALRMKGETAEELAGFARAMREKSHRVEAGLNGEPLLDTCGTGGDGACTFNISTIAAFVVAGAGVRVAKHGNRSISSQCGSADILEAFGVAPGMTAELAGEAIRDTGIAFLFALVLHPAMKHAQPARLELRMRTIFNLLGPLTNPAGACCQLIGAPSPRAAAIMAQALAELGTDHSYVVHGSDGLDEVTTTGPTEVFEVRGGKVEQFVWQPSDFGVRRASLDDLRGGDRNRNLEIAKSVLSGASGAPRDIVLVNAAAALMAIGKADTPREAVRIAAESIDSGAAKRKIDELSSFSRARLQNTPPTGEDRRPGDPAARPEASPAGIRK